MNPLSEQRTGRLNLSALPNQTNVIFLMIVTVLVGTVTLGSLNNGLYSVQSLAVALCLLPLRSFLAQPERRLARLHLVPLPEEQAPLLKAELQSLARRLALRRTPHLVYPAAKPFPFRRGGARQGQLTIQSGPSAEISVPFSLALCLFQRCLIIGNQALADQGTAFQRVFPLGRGHFLAFGRACALRGTLQKQTALHTFGTFRRWYIALRADEAERLETQLQNPSTAPIAQAQLLHELYHFKTGDYWQLEYLRQVLRFSVLIMTWGLALFLGLGVLILLARPTISQLARLTPFLQQMLRLIGPIPPELQTLFQHLLLFFSAMVQLLQKLNQRVSDLTFARIMVFTISSTYPFGIIGLLFWIIYWPRFWRKRELYADAGVVHAQRSSRPLQAVLTGIPLRFLPPAAAPLPPIPPVRRQLWDRRKALKRLFRRPDRVHPETAVRLQVLKQPELIFETWQGSALLVGTFSILLEIGLLTPLTLRYTGRFPLHFPVLALVLIITLNFLLPHLIQGKQAWPGILKILGVVTGLRLLLILSSLLIFVVTAFNSPGSLEGLLALNMGDAEAFITAGPQLFLAEMALKNLAQVAIFPLVSGAAFGLMQYAIRDVLTWYSYPEAETYLMRTIYWVIAGVLAVWGLTVLPLATALLLSPSRLTQPAYLAAAIGGFALMGIGAGIFRHARRKYALRCPVCHETLPASSPGIRCVHTTCRSPLLPWLLSDYDS